MAADEERVAAGKIGAQVSLDNVRLWSLTVRQAPHPGDPGVVRVVTDVQPSPHREEGVLQIHVPYTVTGTLVTEDAGDIQQASEPAAETGGGEEIMKIDAYWVLDYQLPSEFECSEQDLQSFASVSGLFAAHPYMRELVQSTTVRMGLPPLVLDVVKSPLDVPAAKGEPAGDPEGGSPPSQANSRS